MNGGGLFYFRLFDDLCDNSHLMPLEGALFLLRLNQTLLSQQNERKFNARVPRRTVWRLKKTQSSGRYWTNCELCFQFGKPGVNRASTDMDPMKAQQLAAELEVEMMADMYNRYETSSDWSYN